MCRVEYLFDLQIQHRKSRILKPSQQLLARRVYWWCRLKWITCKWKLRHARRHRTGKR